jgi:hypothetical protein
MEPELAYEQFFADFGPVKLSSVVRFCKCLHAVLAPQANVEGPGRRVYCHITEHTLKRSNAIFLLGAYLVRCRS